MSRPVPHHPADGIRSGKIVVQIQGPAQGMGSRKIFIGLLLAKDDMFRSCQGRLWIALYQIDFQDFEGFLIRQDEAFIEMVPWGPLQVDPSFSSPKNLDGVHPSRF